MNDVVPIIVFLERNSVEIKGIATLVRSQVANRTTQNEF